MELYEKFIIDDDITFKYARGKSVESGKEFHSFHEVIYFMGGKARFLSEDTQTTLQAGTLIIIPKETYHQLMIIGAQEDYRRCVLHFADIEEMEPLISENMKQTLLIKADEQFIFLFKQLTALTDGHRPSKINSLIMRSTLSLLLNMLSLKHYTCINSASEDTISKKAVQYISQNIYAPLHIEDIAKEINVSVSHLSHTFKQQMGISLRQFILKKKMAIAERKIMDGVPAAKVAEECGFSDYSGFYKQYKKMFGKAPSDRYVDMK